MTKEEKAIAREEKRIAREIQYEKEHFFCKEVIMDKDGKTSTVKYPVSGYYTEESVIFTWDSNCYIVLVNSHKEIEETGKQKKVVKHTAHIKQYTRCKESSKSYYYKSKLDESSKKVNTEIAETVTTGLSIEDTIAKAHTAKGFKVATSERILQCVECAKSNALTVYNRSIKAKARTAEKEAKKEVA